MVLSNYKMEEMVSQLKPLLAHRDKVGYYAARNYRILENNLIEYTKFKEDLICQYGEQEKDAEGNLLPTYTLSYADENFKKFEQEIKQYTDIEHTVTLMKLKYDEVIGLLSGEEILSIDWMLEN